MTVVTAPKRAISSDPGIAAHANSTTGRPARMPTSVSDMSRSWWISGISGGTANMVIRMPLPASHKRATRTSSGADLPRSVAGSGDRIRLLQPRFPQAAEAPPVACLTDPGHEPDMTDVIALTGSSPERAMTAYARRCDKRQLRQIDRLRPLIQLNVGAPGIRYERQRDAGLLVLAVGPIELDAARFELLDEGLQVRHVEADMIEDTAFGRSLRGVGLVEAQLRARNVGDGSVVSQARLRTKELPIPRLALSYGGFGQEEMHVLMPDGDVLAFVFQNFDSQAIRRHDIGLVQPAVIPW